MKKLLTALALAATTVSFNSWSQGWIVGGQSAQEGQFPWIADIRAGGGHLCGSSLIAPQWVLTAAHCCFDENGNVVDTSAYSFRFNTVRTNSISPNPSGGVVRTASKIFVHPQYDEMQFFSNGCDLALIKLNQPVSSITPIALPAMADTGIIYATGYPVKIAGWGLKDTTSLFPTPDTMKYCSTKVFDHTLCSDNVGGLTYRAFCAGYKTGEEESGAAAGDSGGPVWIENGNSKTLTGLVSGGVLPWTVNDRPGVFTKVAMFRPWIDSVMAANGGGINAIPAPWDDEHIKIGTDRHTLHLYFGLMEARQVTCDVYNAEGKKLYSTVIQQPSYRNYTLDIGSLPASMYIVRVHDAASGKYFTRKVLRH
jgi:secreted trypsin-like serine protease